MRSTKYRRKIRKGIKRMRAKLDRKTRQFSDDETEVPAYCPQDKGK